MSIDKRDGQTRKPVETKDSMFPKSESKPLSGDVPKSQRPGGPTPVCDKR